jgi:hypothetical protein
MQNFIFRVKLFKLLKLKINQISIIEIIKNKPIIKKYNVNIFYIIKYFVYYIKIKL